VEAPAALLLDQMDFKGLETLLRRPDDDSLKSVSSIELFLIKSMGDFLNDCHDSSSLLRFFPSLLPGTFTTGFTEWMDGSSWDAALSEKLLVLVPII
jgi:hypothetical protein